MTQQLKIQGLTRRQSHLDAIRNHYWHLRALRSGQQAKRRKLYRMIAKEKAVLLSDGFDIELLRLYCYQYASLNRAAIARYEAYAKQFADILQKIR